MSRRFLVIEDDPGCETVITRVLSSIDPQAVIDSEESAEQALETLERRAQTGDQAYDLIIADIFLSGKVTGLDFWQKYRDEHPDIPILFISSLPVNRFFETIGRNTIAPAYLPKPFHAGEAKQIIKGLLVYH
jgi:DNA-binding response OmpR family regulator